MNINIDNLNKNSLIMQWNVDTNGNPASVRIENEVHQISTTHNLIQLAQIPDDYYKVQVGVDGETDWLREVYNRDEIAYDTYFVDYGLGYVYFDKSHAGKSVIADYYGRGVILLSDSRIFHKNGDTFVDTWDNIMNRSKDALDLLESAGGLTNAIKVIDQKVEQGNQVADRIEGFIEETEFYGYTILLSREAFVIKAKEDGNVETGEYGDIYTDVVVYKGATQVTAPTLNISLTNQVNCEFEVIGQRIKLKTGSMNVDAIKGQATVVIDCGDGLIAQRIIEVTKVFDGVSQYQVEIGNSFYSFNANSDGTIEEEQSVTCDINVTKANELYESYTVSIQNMPKGLTHTIVNGTKVNNVTFTATAGESLPDNGSVSIIVQMADNTVISKTFSFGKTKQGVDAKSLILTGNQIFKYDAPDYTGTPSPYRSIINVQASGLSGTPNWYVLNENNEWDLIVGQTGTTLEVYHNDSVIWKDRKETTIKCELDGYSDEITLIKIANGATGSDAYSILLSNEATSIPTDEEGNAPTNEVQKQYTTISVYRGSETISPTRIEVVKDAEESYRATVIGNEVHLQSISNDVNTVRIPINITVDGLVFQRVWTISKSKQGSVGQSGSTLILNIEGGTRSITYNQMNVNPRPITSASFTARLYENGVEVLEGVGYYWSCVGHVRGTSTTRTFTPTIIDTYDESMLSNQITVTTTYKGNTISNTVPIAITKDVSGIDWVTDWDSRKVSIRDTEVLTPKIFAGTYNQVSDSVTGVAIGQDVLNDGQTIGIVAYQDNTPTLMVGVDGSIEIGDPYQNRHQDGVGIGYNNGQFVGRFSQLTIAGVDVPTEEVVNDKITQAVADAQNQLKAEVEEVNSALVDLNDYVSNAVRDGILDEVEKGKIDNLMQVVKQEVADVEGQYTSIRTNQYLTDGAVIEALDLAYTEYRNAYHEVNTKYNGLVASGSETGEIAGMVTTGDTSDPIGNGEVATEIPEGGTDDNGLLIDEVPIIGEDDIVDSGGVYPQLTVSNIDEFMLALDNFRISSNSLYQVMNQALTSISESQATQISEKAKEEVIREVNDVSDALAGLEQTMNGDFKNGLLGQMNLANLRERLKQLDIEKKDIDGQYSVMSTHSALDTTTKNKLVSAKGKLDSAHTQLVTKINAVIADNLLTSAELEEVNNLIVAYSTALGEYSKVAQEANIAIAVNSAKNAVDAITDEDVFNKVTNFGKTQGLFIENGGKVYINAQYIQTRGFVATKDDGTKTFEIDKNGNVNIVANSFTLTGQGNVATEDYVNSAIEGIVNKNISFSLSNEFQIIPTNATYYPFETQSYVVQIYGYKGSEEITNFTIGTVTSTNAIKAVVSNVNRSVTFTVTPNTSLGTTHGYVDIPITYEGKSYNKRWSWSVAKQGDQAPQINITGEQVFRYTNNFTGTPTPASITLTANVYNTTVRGKWQYLNSSSWVDCNVTSKTLSLQPTSYTLSSLKRATVRYIVEEVFDTFTVVAVSDGANGVDGQDGANGQDGADGKGIASITEQYYHSTSMTTQTGGSWSTTVPTATRGKYIWTRSVIKYTDSTTTTTTPICVSGSDGANGNNGANGTDGIGITSVDVEYAQNTSTTTAPTSGWTTTSPTWASGKYIWSRTKTTYSNGKVTYTNPACITGQKGDTGASGTDAITIVLTNENHTFSANSSGNITSAQSTTTNITAYKGANTTSVTIGALPTVTGLALSKSGSTVTIKANTGTSLADTGSFDIPLTIDGKLFTKNFSWTKVRAGATGATGTSAKAVDIIASSQVFKSTDGGMTFSPSTITLTPKLQNLAYLNWQYSTNGGSSWTTVSSGSNGLTISSGVLTVSKSSPLYTSSVTSIAFRVNTSDSAYYDIVTIVKLYDVGDIQVGSRNYLLNSNFTKTTTSSGTTNKNPNLYPSNWGGYNGGISNPTTNYHAHIDNDTFGYNVVEYNETDGTRRWKGINQGNLQKRIKGVKEFTISMDVYATASGTKTWGGFHYTKIGGTTQSFHAGSFSIGSDKISVGKWSRVSAKVPMGTDVDFSKPIAFYIYGYDFSSNAILYIKDVVLTQGNTMSDWTPAPEDVSQEIDDSIKDYDKTLNQLKVFNKLTNNGQTQGIYLQDSKLYINGEYIKTGTIRADLVKVQVDGKENILPFNYVTFKSGIESWLNIDETNEGIPYAEMDMPIYQGGGSNSYFCRKFGSSTVYLEPNTRYFFSCDIYADVPRDGVETYGVGGSTGTGAELTLMTAMNERYVTEGRYVPIFIINSLATETTKGQWTRKVYEFTTPTESEFYSLSNHMYIELNGSNYNTGSYGYVRIANMALEKATEGQATASTFDYLTQLKERRIDLTDDKFYHTRLSIDGFSTEEGIIEGTTTTDGHDYLLNYDGLTVSKSSRERYFVGKDKSYYSYEAGSSGTISGHNNIYGVGGVHCNPSDEYAGYRGIFAGVHYGFQIPNSTAFGRPDIYVHNGQWGMDFEEWQLLGDTIEPRGLVRRDDSKNIITNHQLKFLVGGGTDTANVWNQEQYNATGNGQMLTYSAGKVFVSNPKTPLVLESSVTPSVKIGSDVEHQIFHTGYVPKSGNWWNGGAVRVSGDGVAEVGKYIDFHASNSSTSDYDMRLSVENDGGMRCTGSIRAGGGFDCSGGYWIDGYQCVARAGHGGFDFGHTGANTAILSANVPTWWNGSVSQTIYTTGNKPSVINPKGVMSNAEYGRNVYDSGIYTYNLHNNSLINGDSSWSAYAGYWSVLSWGRGTGGSAQLAVDWTAGGKGIYIRSLRDTQDNWWTWKRIPNDQWVQTSTSDIRYKEVMSDVDLDDCYSMVKNIGLHSYLLLDEEDRHTEGFDAELAFLQATQEEGISRKLQMGVIAQEMLDYKCADFVVVQDVLKGKDGEVLSDRYSIDAYNYASAILGGLQKEIQVRDEQYEELKQENEELKAKVDSLEQRLAKLEVLLLGQE